MAIFSDTFLRLRQELDRAHENRLNVLGRIRTEVADLARANSAELAEHGQTRRAEFAVMIQDLRSQVHQQAEQTRGRLAEISADLRQGGAIFARRVAPRASHNGRQR